MLDVQQLNDKIQGLPHWRLLVRPATYRKRIDDVKQAKTLIQETAVMFRGWDFPHLSERIEEQILEDKYFASGADFYGHKEYWRLYYSGQFIHLHALREHTEEDWRVKLKKHALQCMKGEPKENIENAPGFVNIVNMVYTLTEFFEFVSRLAGKKLYDEALEITLTLGNIKGFSLIAELPKFWYGFYPATSNEMTKSWTTEAEALIAKSRELAIDGVVFLLNRFGWDKVPVNHLKDDQQKLLSGRF